MTYSYLKYDEITQFTKFNGDLGILVSEARYIPARAMVTSIEILMYYIFYILKWEQ